MASPSLSKLIERHCRFEKWLRRSICVVSMPTGVVRVLETHIVSQWLSNDSKTNISAPDPIERADVDVPYQKLEI